MPKRESVFKKLDEALFKQIESYLISPAFQSMSEHWTSLDDEAQKILNKILSILFVVLPLILVTFLYFKNHQIDNEKKTKQEIIKSIDQFTSQHSTLSVMQGQILSSSNIKDKKDLDNKLLAAFKEKNIPTEKLKIFNYKEVPPTGNLAQLNADILFSQIGVESLTNFLDILTNKQKIKIALLKVEKDQKTLLLNGKVHIIHFGKAKL